MFYMLVLTFLLILKLNNFYRLYDWETMNRRDVRDILKAQAQNTQLEFEQRTKDVILQFAEQGNTTVVVLTRKYL